MPSAPVDREGWDTFFGELRQAPSGLYEHAPSGVTFSPSGTLGQGVYGEVTLFKASPECGASFCVKRIEEDAADEIAAIEWVNRKPNSVRCAVAECAVLSRWTCRDGRGEEYTCADVGMRAYEGSLGKYTEHPGSPAFARGVCVVLASHVDRLWKAGAAYCDMKPQNVLYAWNDGKMRVVLGDLGSIALRGSSQNGLFTFPPRRAMRQSSKHLDGIAVPEERDMVWGVAIMILSILKGGPWVNARLCCGSIRGSRGGTQAALDRCGAAVLHALAGLRAKHSPSADMEACAQAVELGLRGWEGGSATLDEMRSLLLVECPVTPSPPKAKRRLDDASPSERAHKRTARNIFPTT